MGGAVRRPMLMLAALMVACGSRTVPAHPLDPLSSREIATAVAVLREAGDVDADTRFALVDLDEPSKSAVMAWRPGQPFARKAFVVARRDRTVYEAVVDLGARSVERWQAIPGVQSAILTEEWNDAQRVTIADRQFRAALRQRGYASVDGIFCAPLAAGAPAGRAERGRRLLRVACFDAADSATNLWGRPIEGLTAIVDLDTHKVVRIVDTGAVPVSRQNPSLDEAAQSSLKPALKPVLNEAPAGHNFTVDGNTARWADWAFHFRLDRRAGLIVSLVRYLDQGRERMVLYRGSLAELFVPYMDGDINWSFRNFLDVGEYGLGLLSSPLAPGIDCPADAAFFDAVLPNDRGAPLVGKSVICLFERNTGAPLWRHFETETGAYQGRPAVELVMRTIPSVGNYDYIIDWVLTEAGAIRIEVGATGTDAVKGVRTRALGEPNAAADTASGALVAPNLVAVNHDHFLSFRLDVDIDEAANTLMRERLVRAPQGLWRVVAAPVGGEGALAGDGHHAEIWRIVNPNLINRLGQNPGYELRPGHTATSLLAPDDKAQRRGGFAAAPLWLTAYDPSELYAAGPYPNQSPGGDGLPVYAARRRPVANADIVLWYTMGFHHVTRPEDWPVLPVMWHSVALVPDGFFDRNPALAVRRDFAPAASGR